MSEGEGGREGGEKEGQIIYLINYVVLMLSYWFCDTTEGGEGEK